MHLSTDMMIRAALVGGNRKGYPYGPTFCGNIYRVYTRMQKLVYVIAKRKTKNIYSNCMPELSIVDRSNPTKSIRIPAEVRNTAGQRRLPAITGSGLKKTMSDPWGASQFQKRKNALIVSGFMVQMCFTITRIFRVIGFY
ncbi:MAG: hypothetical protein ACQEQN_09605, partial [Thermodesulfobacteriota bacterium]